MLARLKSLWALPERVLELTNLVEHLVEEIEALERVAESQQVSGNGQAPQLDKDELEAIEKKRLEKFHEALTGRSPVRQQILARHRAAKQDPYRGDKAPRFKPFE